MAHVIKCPNCNAPLPAPSGPSQKCPFCGVEVQKTLLKHPAPPPPVPPPGPMPPPPDGTIQPNNTMLWVILSMIVVLVGAAVTGVAYLASRPDRRVTSITRQAEAVLRKTVKARARDWDSRRPFVVDVNGDGVEDVVGKIRVYANSKSTSYPAAVDGKNNELLWRGEALPRKHKIYLAPALLLMTSSNMVRAFELKQGKQAWKATLADKISALFLGEEGTIILKTKDEAWSVVALASGAVTPRESKKMPSLRLLENTGYSLIPRQPLMMLNWKQWPGLRLTRVYCPPHLSSQVSPQGRALPWHSRKAYCYRDGVGLAYAVRDKGSRIPHLIGFDPRTREIVWRRQITPEGSLDELNSGFNQPRAELRGDRALFLYQLPDKKMTMELLAMADGKVLWKRTLTNMKSHGHLGSAVLTRTRIYITHGFSSLDIHDVKDGRLLHHVGD